MTRKRLYIPNAAYHVTFNPKYRIPYFREDVFSFILARVIHEGQCYKDYTLIAYKINPEHVHLLLKCNTEFNISMIIQHVKRISSLHIKMLMSRGTEDERVDFKWTNELESLYAMLVLKYGSVMNIPYPMFAWQPGFNDVIIRSRRHLMMTINYLRKQAQIHNLADNIHLFVASEIPAGIAFL